MSKQENQVSNFVIKFNNGFWKLFDSYRYQDVGMFRLFSEAKQQLKEELSKTAKA